MKKHHSNILILPFLGLLITPISSINKNPGRGVASTELSKSLTKFESFISKEKEESSIPNESKNVDDFCNKLNDLKSELENTKNNFQKRELTYDVVEEQRQKIKSFVRRIYFAKKELNDQHNKEARELFYNDKAPTPFTSEEEALDKTLTETTNIANDLISLLEENESLLNSISLKPETTQEPKKEVEHKEVCEAQNNILTGQMLDLLKQQQVMMENIMKMNQQMLHIQQASFLNPFLSNSIFDNGLAQKGPYTYLNPQPTGNWIYYPNGFNPNQANIFSTPQIPQSADDNFTKTALENPYIPMNPQSQWQLRPTYDFNVDPIQYQTIIPGNFGSEGLTYNMSNSFNM